MPLPADQTHKSTTRLAIWATVLAAATAFTVFWLALRPPPMPYRTAAATTCLLCGFAAGVTAIAWLVIKVSNAFAARYERMEQRIDKYEREVTDRLAYVARTQHQILGALAMLGNGLNALDEKVVKQDQQRCGQITRWIEEVNVLTEKLGNVAENLGHVHEDVDELREAFLDEGLPPRRLVVVAGFDTGTLEPRNGTTPAALSVRH